MARDTSLEAWRAGEESGSHDNQRQKVFLEIEATKKVGITREELESCPSLRDLKSQSITPRVKELLDEGRVREMEATRKTQKDCNAHIVVASSYYLAACDKYEEVPLRRHVKAVTDLQKRLLKAAKIARRTHYKLTTYLKRETKAQTMTDEVIFDALRDLQKAMNLLKEKEEQHEF